MPTALNLTNISKSFILPHEKRDTLKENFLGLLKKKTYEQFKALENISFQVQKGDFIGIVGKNGSGKSTLLKIIAGIYRPDRGTMEISGTIAPFLELGIGFQPELTARENIKVNGTLLGLTKKEIAAKFDQIVRFAEVEKFLDLKMKNYSSGMQARLAFAIAKEADADIYLCDEVFAVGDEAFQQKCVEVFEQWKKKGKTLILVSHNPAFITQFCSKAILLEKGKIATSGDAEMVIDEYHRRIHVETMSDPSHISMERSQQNLKDYMDSDIHITDVRFFNKQGAEKDSFKTGEQLTARIFYKINKPLKNPVFGIAIHRDDGVHISGPNTRTSQYPILEVKRDGYLDCIIDPTTLLGGRYVFTVSCFDDTLTRPYDYHDKKYTFSIERNRENQYGLMELPVTWRHYG